jgi:CheY-like chemotaxis protein
LQKIIKSEILHIKILAIEDDIIFRNFIKKMLSDYYQVDFANNTELALELINENIYAALLVDINLDMGMNGVELTQKVRKDPRYKPKPIIAVTAYVANYDRDEFL